MIEDLLDLGDAWQNIVAGITLSFKHRLNLLVDVLMKFGRVVGSEGDIAIGDELLYLGIVEEKCVVGHFLSFRGLALNGH